MEIYGAAKIVQFSGPGNVLSPVVDQNNVDSQLLRETGVLISEEATPTLLNNVISNLRNAVIETENQPQAIRRRASARGRRSSAPRSSSTARRSTVPDRAQMGNWRYSLGTFANRRR